MMTGPEHYAHAAQLLRQIADDTSMPVPTAQLVVAAATAHAQLATAAAIALGVVDGELAPDTAAARRWREAILP